MSRVSVCRGVTFADWLVQLGYYQCDGQFSEPTRDFLKWLHAHCAGRKKKLKCMLKKKRKRLWAYGPARPTCHVTLCWCVVTHVKWSKISFAHAFVIHCVANRCLASRCCFSWCSQLATHALPSARAPFPFFWPEHAFWITTDVPFLLSVTLSNLAVYACRDWRSCTRTSSSALHTQPLSSRSL